MFLKWQRVVGISFEQGPLPLLVELVFSLLGYHRLPELILHHQLIGKVVCTVHYELDVTSLVRDSEQISSMLMDPSCPKL